METSSDSMRQSQIFFIILLSLKRNLISYERRKSFFSKGVYLDKRNIANQTSEYLEVVNLEKEIESIHSIVDLYRVSFIISGQVGQNIELNYMSPFKKWGVPGSDLDFILDYWYDDAQIFKVQGDYRELILRITNNFQLLDYYIYNSPQRKRNIVKWYYSNLGEISSQIISHIESKLGRPDWNIPIDEIIKKISRKSSSNLIELSLEFLKLFNENGQLAWPELITDNELIKHMDKEMMIKS